MSFEPSARRSALVLACAGGAFAGSAIPATAAELAVTIGIPRIEATEYHRPYLAAWIETPQQAFVSNVAVWYDLKNSKGEGPTWLKDLRTWWRRSGRSLQVPVDGITGATRAPGEHSLKFRDTASLKPGQYEMVVEAAREVGGREVVRVPFEWPPTAPTGKSVSGQTELGAIGVRTAP